MSLSFLAGCHHPILCHCRAVIYLNIQVVRGRQKVICLLQEQIANVREHCPCPSPLLHSLLQPQHCQFRLWPQQHCHSPTPLRSLPCL